MKTYTMKRIANAKKFTISEDDWSDYDMAIVIEYEIWDALREKNKISKLPLCLELKIKMDATSYLDVFDSFTKFDTPEYQHKYDYVNEVLTLWYDEVPELDFENDERIQRMVLENHFEGLDRYQVDRYMKRGHRNGFFITTVESWVNDLKNFHMEEDWEILRDDEYESFEEFEKDRLKNVYDSDSYEELFEHLYNDGIIPLGGETIHGGCLYGTHYVLVASDWV